MQPTSDIDIGVLDDVRTAFRDGTSIAALAREHEVSRVAIRTAVADLQPGRAPRQPGEPVAVVLEMPGKLANHLRGNDNLGEAERAVLAAGREVRRGQGFTLHLTATPQVHQALLAAAAALGSEGAASADRKAYRVYQQRLDTALTASAGRTR